MAQFDKLSMNELVNDYVETLHDIAVCKRALNLGVTAYSHGSVQERLDVNKEIQATIERELNRREFGFLIAILKDC